MDDSFTPGTVLNLVFGKADIGGVQGPFIEVWIKDPVSGTVTTKHWHEREKDGMWEFIYTTLRIMNLRNKVLHKEKHPKPKPKVKIKKTINLDDLL